MVSLRKQRDDAIEDAEKLQTPSNPHTHGSSTAQSPGYYAEMVNLRKQRDDAIEDAEKLQILLLSLLKQLFNMKLDNGIHVASAAMNHGGYNLTDFSAPSSVPTQKAIITRERMLEEGQRDSDFPVILPAAKHKGTFDLGTEA